MRTPTRGQSQTVVAVACSFLALVVVAGLTGLSARESGRDVQVAAEELGRAEQLAQTIVAAREQPVVINDETIASSDLAVLVESAAEQAGFDTGQIVRIWPESSTPVEGTDFRRTRTRVLLRGVPLPELGAFLVTLTDTAGGLNVDSLRLAAESTQPESRSERWDAEIALTQLYYAAGRESDGSTAPDHAGSDTPSPSF